MESSWDSRRASTNCILRFRSPAGGETHCDTRSWPAGGVVPHCISRLRSCGRAETQCVEQSSRLDVGFLQCVEAPGILSIHYTNCILRLTADQLTTSSCIHELYVLLRGQILIYTLFTRQNGATAGPLDWISSVRPLGSQARRAAGEVPQRGTIRQPRVSAKRATLGCGVPRISAGRPRPSSATRCRLVPGHPPGEAGLLEESEASARRLPRRRQNQGSFSFHANH